MAYGFLSITFALEMKNTIINTSTIVIWVFCSLYFCFSSFFTPESAPKDFLLNNSAQQISSLSLNNLGQSDDKQVPTDQDTENNSLTIDGDDSIDHLCFERAFTSKSIASNYFADLFFNYDEDSRLQYHINITSPPPQV